MEDAAKMGGSGPGRKDAAAGGPTKHGPSLSASLSLLLLLLLNYILLKKVRKSGVGERGPYHAN